MTADSGRAAGWGTGPGVVTPEAVRLDFEVAGVGSRGVALVLDLLLQGTVLFALSFSAVMLTVPLGPGMPDWVARTIYLLLVFGIIWGYPTALETLWRGRTLGKAAMGLRVVTVEGAPVRFRHAAIRAALSLIDIYVTFGGVAVLTALLTRRSQRLGDLAAGTIVLRERSGSAAPAAVQFRIPPGAEGYAATLDTSSLRPTDYQAIRTFLLRAPTLRGEVRGRLAMAIAQPLAARLRHTPPAGVGPELFLASLAARYQQRGGWQGATPSAPASGWQGAMPSAPASGSQGQALPAPPAGPRGPVSHPPPGPPVGPQVPAPPGLGDQPADEGDGRHWPGGFAPPG